MDEDAKCGQIKINEYKLYYCKHLKHFACDFDGSEFATRDANLVANVNRALVIGILHEI